MQKRENSKFSRIHSGFSDVLPTYSESEYQLHPGISPGVKMSLESITRRRQYPLRVRFISWLWPSRRKPKHHPRLLSFCSECFFFFPLLFSPSVHYCWLCFSRLLGTRTIIIYSKSQQFPAHETFHFCYLTLVPLVIAISQSRSINEAAKKGKEGKNEICWTLKCTETTREIALCVWGV